MEPVRMVAVAVVVVAALIDLRTRRIPNLLTFGASAVALGYHAWTNGLSGIGHGAAGWATGTAVFLPMFLLGGMGAGDVKLMAAVGAWLGFRGALWSACFAVLFGGLLALLVSIRSRYLATAFRNLWALFGFWRTTGIKPLPGVTLRDSTGPRLAYGVAIALGTLAAALFK